MSSFNPRNLGIADTLVKLNDLSHSPSLALSSNSRMEHNLVKSFFFFDSSYMHICSFREKFIDCNYVQLYFCSLFCRYWCFLTICWVHCPLFYYRNFAHDVSFSGMLFSLYFSSLTWWTNITSSNDITNFTSSEKFLWPPILDELPLLYTLIECILFSQKTFLQLHNYTLIIVVIWKTVSVPLNHIVHEIKDCLSFLH